MVYQARQERLGAKLRDYKLDGLLITHLPNIRYLCGFTGSAGALLFHDGRLTLFTDGRYREQARQEAQGARVVIGRGSAMVSAAKALSPMRRLALGLEGDHMTVSARASFAKTLASGVRLRSTSGLVEELRAIKDAEEIARIRAAVDLAASLFEPLLPLLRPGVCESAVAAKLEYSARRAGAESMSFATIVAAGRRSAWPHGRASAHPIPDRGFVMLDFGVILAGYCSDMTRTVHVGKPTQRARRMYQAVREAQQSALDSVRPSVAVAKVDHAARSVLRRHGLASYFSHSTGHGVGLEIHEPPRLGRGQREVLRPGMVVTIEPGIYIGGLGGVRIEDMVVVTESGGDVLTPTTKELITL